MGIFFSAQIGRVFAIDALVNGLAWFHAAFIIRNEKYFDLVGGITYWACVLSALHRRNGDISARQAVNSVLTLTWSGRLSTFLFSRIQQDSVDKRARRNENTERAETPQAGHGQTIVISSHARANKNAVTKATPLTPSRGTGVFL